jgi:hypothetical protein
MHRVADLYPGRAPPATRSSSPTKPALPHTLRPVNIGDNALAKLDVLVGVDDNRTLSPKP